MHARTDGAHAHAVKQWIQCSFMREWNGLDRHYIQSQCIWIVWLISFPLRSLLLFGNMCLSVSVDMRALFIHMMMFSKSGKFYWMRTKVICNGNVDNNFNVSDSGGSSSISRARIESAVQPRLFSSTQLAFVLHGDSAESSKLDALIFAFNLKWKYDSTLEYVCVCMC